MGTIRSHTRYSFRLPDSTSSAGSMSLFASTLSIVSRLSSSAKESIEATASRSLASCPPSLSTSVAE